MPTIDPPLAEATAQILFFGRLGDVFGRARQVAIPRSGCSLAELKRRLAGEVEGGARALGEPGVRGAVDRQMALDDGALVHPGQEVALFSAFSGG